MKAGMLIRLPDAREGTVVYNGLDGRGIMFGRVIVDQDIINGVNSLFGEPPADYPYHPEAMLRDPKLARHWPGMECVGEEFEIIEESADA
jgi:hypothetical protein